METWKILQVMRVNAAAARIQAQGCVDSRWTHIASGYAGRELTVRNALDLSDVVDREIKIDLQNVVGALAGNVRVYTGTVPGTNDAIIVTLQRVECAHEGERGISCTKCGAELAS